jgi:hypothetical protein
MGVKLNVCKLIIHFAEFLTIGRHVFNPLATFFHWSTLMATNKENRLRVQTDAQPEFILWRATAPQGRKS